MGHVNNANYLTYLEIARVAYYEQVTGNALPIGDFRIEEVPVPPGTLVRNPRLQALLKAMRPYLP